MTTDPVVTYPRRVSPTLTHLCMMTIGTEQRLYALDNAGRLLEAQWKRIGDEVHLSGWVAIEVGVEEKT